MTNDNQILVCSVLFPSNVIFDTRDVCNVLKSEWNIDVTKFLSEDLNVLLEINRESIIFGIVDAKIPDKQLENSINTAYNWPSVLTDLQPHKQHAIVSLVGDGLNNLSNLKLFTKVVFRHFKKQ